MDRKRIALIVGHGLLQERDAANAMDALINLALMTGSIGSEGNGVHLLSMENNLSGALDMGTIPDYLPGRNPLKDDMIRRHWRGLWDVNISPDPGLDMARMVEEAGRGNLKALYIMGENPVRSLPHSERVKKVLEKLDFLVVQDILDTETARITDVLLPGAAFSEKEGSFTNMEGRIQFFDPVVHPPGEARPDWMILDQLMEKMGSSRGYGSIKKIRTEIGRLVPMYKGLEGNDRATWIKETSRMKLFNGNGQGELIPFSGIAASDAGTSNKDYPLKAVITPSRYHLGSGSRTGLSDRLKGFGLRGEAIISFKTAQKLDLKEGDEVRISSPHGAISRGISPEREIKEGIVFIPMGFNGNDAMDLIYLTGDGDAGTFVANCCDVRIERK